MIVYPGINTADKTELASHISRLNGKVDGIHIDVFDGVFVNKMNVSLEEIGILPEGFFEAHLMVEHPQTYFDLCAEMGFSRVLVHLDALPNADYKEALEMQAWVHDLGMEFGLAFRPEVSVREDECLCHFDYALVMTVYLGLSGQPFLSEQLEQVKLLRSLCPILPIEVDGHVDNITTPQIIAAGASHLVSTSYLGGDDALERYALLKGM